MSLLCGECDRDIIYGDPLHLAISDSTSTQGGIAVCARCLERVPTALRHQTAELHAGALTIYDAASTRNFNGSYTWGGLERGAPRWWISTSEAITRLPRLAAECGFVTPAQQDVTDRRGGLEVQIVLLEGVPPPGPQGRKHRIRAERERDERVEAIYQAFRRGGFRP